MSITQKFGLWISLMSFSGFSQGTQPSEFKSAKELASEHGVSGIIYRAPLDADGQPIASQAEAVLTTDAPAILLDKVQKTGEEKDALASYFTAEENSAGLLYKAAHSSADADYSETFSADDLGEIEPNGFWHRWRRPFLNQTYVRYGYASYRVPNYYIRPFSAFRSTYYAQPYRSYPATFYVYPYFNNSYNYGRAYRGWGYSYYPF